ncbi:MAG TPA: L,D-transpeptidase family protein, partial [Steroidobacteraceae bacterium]|nr:L,D-transpeptidase family protein [Steroidobacteraceae bacterium]
MPRPFPPATRWIAAALALAWAVPRPAAAGGAQYPIPQNGDSVVGMVTTAVAEHEDTLLDIGRRFGVGYEEIIAANPGVDPWLPGEGTEVLIPTRFVLPDAPREGIVVNLPEHRLYYYPPAKRGARPIVITYPISTGKMDWKTPLGVTKVQSKQERPNWYPPESVRSEHEARGDPLPKIIPPGPDNPLGEYAMRLAIPGGSYLIHGTNRPAGVGMQVTHGCIRLYPEDIEELFAMIPVNTKVNLVDQTTKVGWYRGTLYLERQAPLEGTQDPSHTDPAELVRVISAALVGHNATVDWDAAKRAFDQMTSVPVPIAREVLAPTPSAA